MIGSRGPYEQAVLFVHGIGSQKQGDTLVRWGDALAQWIGDWSKGHGDPQKVWFADVVLHPQDGGPAHGDLHIGEGYDKVVWLVEEVWWAGEVQTPSYSRLARFTIQALPMALLGYVGGAFRRNRRWARDNTRPRWLGHWAMALMSLVVGLPLALVMTPVLAALIALLLLVGLVPVPGVRSRVLALQRALTLTLGDSMILLSSPTQRAAMTSRVVDAIRFAQNRGCENLTIVAHSQGAAVVQRALDEHHALLSPPRLVTVGSGINRLHELETLGKNSWLAPGFLGAAGALAAWLWALAAAGEATWAELFLWALGFVGVIAVGGLVSVLPRLIRGPAAGEREPHPRRDKLAQLALGVGMVTFFGVLLGYVVAGVTTAGPAFLPVILFAAALVLGVQATSLLVFREQPRVESDLKAKVSSWLDVYSHLDPVPGGPSLTQDPSWPESVEVRNTGSIVFDHVRYERERDDALAVIAQRLLRDTVGKVRVAENDPGIARQRVARQKRVTVLRLTRWLTAVSALVFVLRHRGALEERAAEGYAWTIDNVSLPGWMPSTVSGGAALAWGIVGVAVVALAGYVLIAKLWGLWNTLESRAVFKPPATTRDNAVFGSMALFGASLSCLLVGVLFIDDVSQLVPTDPVGDWLVNAAFLAFAAFAPAIGFAAWWTREEKQLEPASVNVPKQKVRKHRVAQSAVATVPERTAPDRAALDYGTQGGQPSAQDTPRQPAAS